MIDLVTYIIYALIVAIPVIIYVRRMKRKELLARQAAEKQLSSEKSKP